MPLWPCRTLEPYGFCEPIPSGQLWVRAFTPGIKMWPHMFLVILSQIRAHFPVLYKQTCTSFLFTNTKLCCFYPVWVRKCVWCHFVCLCVAQATEQDESCAAVNKDLTNSRKVSIIMWWSVLISISVVTNKSTRKTNYVWFSVVTIPRFLFRYWYQVLNFDTHTFSSLFLKKRVALSEPVAPDFCSLKNRLEKWWR